MLLNHLRVAGTDFSKSFDSESFNSPPLAPFSPPPLFWPLWPESGDSVWWRATHQQYTHNHRLRRCERHRPDRRGRGIRDAERQESQGT